MHDAVVHLKGKGSLGIEVRGVGTSSGLYSKNGLDDDLGDEDRMDPRKGVKQNPPFEKHPTTVRYLIMKIIIWNSRGALKPNF